MLRYALAVASVCALPLAARAADEPAAELAAPSLAAPRFGPATIIRYRTGAIVTAGGGAVRNVKAMVATPLECPEQSVQIVEEDVTPDVETLQYRLLRGEGCRQMLVTIPYLNAGAEARAVVTYEVETRTVLPPEDPSLLAIPKRPDIRLKAYLGNSPYIDPRHPKIRKAVAEAFKALEAELADEPEDDSSDNPAEQQAQAAPDEAEPNDSAGAGSEASPTADDAEAIVAGSADADASAADPAYEPAEPTDWRRVEAIYDFVIDKIKYKEGEDKSSVQALQDEEGDCQAIGALFVAMCRHVKVPARLVWVHEHQYAEFYLVDDQGDGYWFPVETAGTPAFGEMRIARVILQKGDNFQVPERPRDRLRYATDFLTGLPAAPGGAKPKVRYVREPL